MRLCVEFQSKWKRLVYGHPRHPFQCSVNRPYQVATRLEAVYIRRLEELRKELLGPEHPDVAQSLMMRAGLLGAQAETRRTYLQGQVTDDSMGPPISPFLEPSRAKKEAEKPAEEDSGIISGLESKESAIAGGEWEPLAETLQAGENYLSRDGGIRL
ncbi:unnamed protein product, partial [Ectocarpus fasciculatus]